jgi:hypothetical protein
MHKVERLELIKARFTARFGLPVPGILPVSKMEIRSTVKETVSRVAESMNDSTAAGDENETNGSALSFDSATAHRERESDYLLTLAERRELLRDWKPKPKPAPEPEPEPERFRLTLEEAFAPYRAYKAFCEAVENGPLLLMA